MAVKDSKKQPAIEAVQVQRPDIVNKIVLAIIGVALLIVVVAILSNFTPIAKKNDTTTNTPERKQTLIATNKVTITEFAADKLTIKDAGGKQQQFTVDARTAYTKGTGRPQPATKADVRAGLTINLVTNGTKVIAVHIVSQ